VALSAGDQKVYVKVTAENGTTNTRYALTVHRKNGDAGLASVLGQELNLTGAGSSASAPATGTITVDYRQTGVQLTDLISSDRKANGPAAKAVVKLFSDAEYTTEVASVNLPGASTDVWIQLTAEDTNYNAYYKITVVRDIPTGTSILKVAGTPVTVSGGDGQPASPYQVAVSVDASVERITGDKLTLSEGASTDVDAALAPGETTVVNLVVTAAAGNTANYELSVWRPAVTAELAGLIETTEDLAANGLFKAYTTDSVNAVLAAITSAKTVLANPAATQADLDAAEQAIIDALDALQPKNTPVPAQPDLAGLKLLIDTVRSINTSDYTPASVAVLRAKLAAAQQVLAKDPANVAKVAQAKADLLKALAGLQKHYVTRVAVQVGKVNVAKGKSFQLGGLAYLSSGASEQLAYKSSNPKIAKVTSAGKITAVKPGKAIITATSLRAGANGKKLSVKTTVKVVKKAVKVKKATANVPKRLKVGAAFRLKTVVSGSSATPSKVAFASSNWAIARVDRTGQLTALRPGTVKITINTGTAKRVYTLKITK
jgi:hypothetical protein